MTEWSTPSDLVERLGRRWRRGEFLAAYLRGEEFEPLSLPLRGPSAGELGTRYAEVRDWCATWSAAARNPGVRVEYRRVGGKSFGVNEIPARVQIDELAALSGWLRMGHEIRTIDEIRDRTVAAFPELLDWLVSHPTAALRNVAVWSQLLACVRWIAEHGAPSVYLRQIDADGVDTKFVEAHRSELGALLDAVLPDDRIDRAAPPSKFVERYRLRRKPSYVRFRIFGAVAPFPAGVSELSLRADELTTLAPAAKRIYIIENEVTYLAFPRVSDALVLLGSGYALSRLAGVDWLRDREVHYWGDIDSHGFVILDRLRAIVPSARSMLMDRATLLAHEAHWVREEVQSNTLPAHLTEAEHILFQDLIEGTFGDSVRLEQERIRFGAIRAAVGGHAEG